MFFYKLADYVMRGRKEALLMLVLFSALPFLRWLALSVMALITLRKSSSQSLPILLAVLVLFSLGAWVNIGHWDQVVLIIAVGVWAQALILRATRSWFAVILLTSIVGVVAVVGFHDMAMALWEKQMGLQLKGASAKNQDELAFIGQFATSLGVLGWQLLGFMSLIMGRMMQAMLYNPGGLRAELHFIRAPKWLCLLTVLLIALILHLRSPLVIDMLPLLILPLFAAGLSMLHYLAFAKRMPWILGVYYLSLIWGLVFGVIAMVMLAVADAVFDLRGRVPYRV